MPAPSQRLLAIAAQLPTLLGAAALALGLVGCGSRVSPPSDAITIGLLLPFTGSSSATASNFERAVLYAAGNVNAAGGIHGRPLRVVSADTHSDVARAQSSAESLVNAGALVVVGPESAEVAAQIAPYLAQHQVAFLSPLVGAADDSLVDCTEPWFRLAPSARAFGQALAKQLLAQKVASITLMYARTAYDQALRDALKARFASLNGTVRLELELDPNAQSYAAQVNQANLAAADAIVLTSSPRAGALVVNEFDALSPTPPSWFLSPLLKTDLLVQNVAPDALEGAHGVAPEIYDTSSDFPDAFAKRWQGDRPLEGAYFYYDALALIAFALERAADQGLDLESAIAAAAVQKGEQARWNEIADGLEHARGGGVIYYSGLAGPLVFNSCGDRSFGATSTWQVHAGAIIDD
jgi:ABC-type branched-subunit amino acid transport system substrate-binding protein